MLAIRYHLGILVAIAFLSSPAVAADGGWFVTIDTGRSSFSDHTRFPSDTVFPPETFQAGINSAIAYDSDGTGYRITGGYRFSQYWALELSDVDLGQESASANDITVSSLSCGLPCDNSYNIVSTRKVRGWSLAGTGTLPITEQWSIFARLGYLQSEVELDTVTAPTDNPPYGDMHIPPSSQTTASGLKITYGYGVRWSFTGHWAARLTWDRYKDLQDSFGLGFNTLSFNVSLESIGLEYYF